MSETQQVYRNPGAASDLRTADLGFETLYDIWERYSLARREYEAFYASPISFCASTQQIRHGPYVGITYQTMRRNVERLATAFVSHHKLRPGAIVVLWAANSPEWVVVEQACNRQSFVLAPLYDSLSVAGVSYVLQITCPDLLILSRDKVLRLIAALEAENLDISCLKGVLLISDLAFEKALPGAQINRLEDLLRASGYTGILEDIPTLIETAAHVVEPRPPTPDTISSLIFTSGTSSNPKGVILSHRALVNAAFGWLKTPLPIIQTAHGKRYLSYLPMAHIYERVIQTCAIIVGARVYYWRGNFKGLVADMQECKPDLICGVPKVFITLFNGIRGRLESSFLTRYWFRFATGGGDGAGNNKESRLRTLARRLLFALARKKLGLGFIGLISGGAVLPPSVQAFLQDFFGCNLMQGYGQTEACAAVTVQRDDDYSIGNSGSVCPNVELMIDPETSEILIRGSSLLSRYYCERERFVDNVDCFPVSRDWYRSGDCGEITPDGKLIVRDRLATNFKLLNGEFICPESIETTYLQSPFVSHVFIPCVTNASGLYALVVPSPSLLNRLGIRNFLSGPNADPDGDGSADVVEGSDSSGSTIIRVHAIHKEHGDDSQSVEYHLLALLRSKITEDFARIHRESHLKPCMRIRGLGVLREEPTVENGLLTATQKIRRKEMQSRHSQLIQALVDADARHSA
ncbi:Long chain fatty acid CoA ligase 5 [Giardia muris]|uniref:Long chain fatty acid CoA ligase 5 n=1 Tax=Giardia muris TaxID=5742 RepID=A0A4Z1T113_GIAMU|nr:Long chain fatty acid CoA ligase 5 [Giardia muris]|eukprot:TNJ27593.1 Long chain fatty acid CoA ligase 5 [Giardia muris]